VPLLWLSYAVDYHFWGLNPLGYHLTNIILHAVNSALVVLIAHEFYKSGSFCNAGTSAGNRFLYPAMIVLAGLLFGIHPARVESVVWVTERKDVLNGVFTLGSILFYLRYQHVMAGRDGRGRLHFAYLLSIVLFFCSLLAKPSSLILPVSLLVIDLYPLRRFQSEKTVTILVEKLPYLILSASIAMVSVVHIRQVEGFNGLQELPFNIRVIAAGNSLYEYLKLMIWPVNILPYYNLPRLIPQTYIVCAVISATAIFLAIVFFKKIPRLSTIVFFFTITVFPGLHFFAGGLQVIINTRYTYLPSLLPSIIVAEMIVLLIGKCSEQRHRYIRSAIIGLLAFLLAFYVIATQQGIGNWQNSGTMWSKVIKYRPFNQAYFSRALYYFDMKDYAKAIDDYTVVLSRGAKEPIPDVYNVYAFRGEALFKAGHFEEAVRDFDFAIKAFPHQLYYYYRGQALAEVGRIDEARQDLERAGRAKGQMCWFPAGSRTE
jgi:tetratricopeptide (TPR) repeat protein